MIIEVVLFIGVIYLLHQYLSRPKGLPPGPRGFPVVGSLMVTEVDKAQEYRKKYGDIFSCKMGNVTIVYICDFKLLKEAMGKLEFSDRPKFEGTHFLTEGKEAGVIFSNGQRWSNARRFLLRNLRDLGMGKSSMDDAIITESRHLVEDFKKREGKTITFPDSINIAVLNVVWQLVASRRYDLNDQEVMGLIRVIKTFQDEFFGFFVIEIFPILKMLPAFIRDRVFNMDILTKATDMTKKIIGDAMKTRKAEMDPSHSENVIDGYLLQMQDKTEIAELFNEPDLLKLVFDLFVAGFDTTSNMLRWMILYAAKYPEVQKRVQKQIDVVVPRDEFPTNQHKNQLPLVEAFIHEVLRCSSLIPFSVMHSNSVETQLGGYVIPEESLVFGATGLIHRDPKYWDQPEEFRIDRFLDDNESFVSQREGFAPFGIGKRGCLGESLARMELSIFTASLLQNFTFSPPEGKPIDLTPDDLPLNHFPKDVEFVASFRQ